MYNGLTFCILADPSLQALAPLYITALALGLIAYTASVVLTRSGIGLFKKISIPKLLSDKKVQISMALLLQLGILASFQMKFATVVERGRTIKLCAKAADPVDLFRGNYQALTYPDTDLTSKDVNFHDLRNVKNDSIVYVAFQDAGDFWKATDVYASKPAQNPQFVFLKARVTSNSRRELYVQYGIQQYYFAEGHGVQMQNGATASVKVDDQGDAVLIGLTANSR